MLEHIDTAIPVHVNFAISGKDRVVRELSCWCGRRYSKLFANELKSTVTALLLSCEMALMVPNLPSAAEIKMRAVRDLAQEVRGKLEES